MRRLLIALVLLILAAGIAPAATAQTLPTPAFPFTTTTDPASLIGSYYNAITLQDYARAYSYWETPPHSQTLEQFAAGFADTLSASALVGVPYETDAGAGNEYASLPALVIAQRRDGRVVYYAGCFVAHKTNVPVGDATQPNPNWYLRTANLAVVASAQAALNRLATACAAAG